MFNGNMFLCPHKNTSRQENDFRIIVQLNIKQYVE